jgi:TrmH family RNA methyltransferase|nr:TrmH family RNA methyltransferase [Candidatus Krumholzibacteria bacterium]
MSQNDLLLSSLQNDQVKTLVKLRNRHHRDRLGLTIIEEPLVIARALQAGFPLSTVYYCPENLDAGAQSVLEDIRRQTHTNCVQVTAPVMAKISYRDKPEGLLVTAPQVKRGLADLSLPPDPLVIVLESVEKPGNLGAVLRIADGAGAHAVLLCGQGTDLFNPNVLRASRGAFFSIPTVVATTDEVLAFCHQQAITTVATSPAAPEAYTACDFTRAVALVLGTEHDGLSTQLLDHCQTTVSIPMLGTGDSLNVATSSAVLLYEAQRQRAHNKG